MKTSTRIAIIIPAFNEAFTIKKVVQSVLASLKKAKITADVFVIDDGSTDATAELATEAGAFVVHHILNSGVGSATATGIAYAHQKNYDLAVTMDADDQHSPQDAIKGLGLMQKGDIDLLIGSRLIDAQGMSRLKQFGNRSLSFITFLLFGVSVTDSQSGLRVFSKEALAQLRWKTAGYEFCSEMIWRAKQQGLTIGEYPIKAIYTDYSKAKGQNNWNAFYLIKTLLRHRIAELMHE
ncbi:MAG TPA: glycosyltransferase family 2 protein [Candidatus Saccharimonadales bacterium]|nr:glycosyltransferase family 2 protein [Candidatus Saccharimonadales bacterium]